METLKNFSISELWELLSSYTNPFKIIFSCILYAGIAFLAFLLLVIFLRKFILVKRRYLVFKIFAWIYMITIPIVATVFGFKFGLINGIRIDLKTHMVTYTKGLNNLLKEQVGQSADEFILEATSGHDSLNRPLSFDNAIDNFSEKVYVDLTTVMETAAQNGSKRGKAAKMFLKVVKSDGVAFGLKLTTRKVLQKGLGIRRGASKEIMSTQFDKLQERGLVSLILEEEVDRFFIPMEKSVIMVFLLILFLPVTEIIIAVILYRKTPAYQAELQKKLHLKNLKQQTK
ncbi:MAG: hypothetical protein IAF38_11635 [Bacteroidia bacterium]|nr:hypothetical protein [Bacteroidia bacterium]